MKKIKCIILFITLIVTANTFAQTAFPKNNYVAIAKVGDNAASPNYTIYTTTTPDDGNSFVAGSTISASGVNINGIGLNKTDMLVYALGTTGDNGTEYDLSDDFSLYKIGADGTSINLGYLPLTGQGATIPILGGKAELVNMSAGTVTDNGTYIYNTLALTQSGVNKLRDAVLFNQALNLTTDDARFFIAELDNVADITVGNMPTAPSNYYELDISNPRVNNALAAFLDDINNNFSNGGLKGGVSGGIQDFDVSPSDGALYSYVTYPDPNPSGKSVDVVGFPVKIGAFTPDGKATVVPIGSTDNETPDQEDAGLTFSIDGSKFYGLFTSGQYAEINLITGETENIKNSNIPTKLLRGQQHLRGDMARAIPETLPVKFGPVSASITGNQLNINWVTEQEKNNDHFEIYVSMDGVKFAKIDDVATKAINGSSDISLSYEYNASINRAMSVAGISLMIIGLITFGFNRRSKLLMLGIVLAGMGLFAVSCSKSDAPVELSGASKLYVKIVQIDKDGNSNSSKTVIAYKAN